MGAVELLVDMYSWIPFVGYFTILVVVLIFSALLNFFMTL